MADHPALAVVGDRLCTGLLDVTDDLAALESEGFWAVVLPMDGPPTLARFADVRPARPWPGPPWRGPAIADWTSSLDESRFSAAVVRIREEIAAGNVYQVNLTRVLQAPLPDPGSARIEALGAALAHGNPSPYHAVVSLPRHGVAVASASPERFLRREGTLVESSPIKGTAATPGGFTDKDRAENLMIVDLVRNDLGRVCRWGTVGVPSLMGLEAHPGLYHLVSTVRGTLREGHGWADAIDATFPPGSVTGAPKLAALDLIGRLEPNRREFYCGAIGWVDADRGLGDLNVAIRTFWIRDGHLFFGTGGAITWDSTASGEWEETELKARRLLAVASGGSVAGAGER